MELSPQVLAEIKCDIPLLLLFTAWIYFRTWFAVMVEHEMPWSCSSFEFEDYLGMCLYIQLFDMF